MFSVRTTWTRDANRLSVAESEVRAHAASDFADLTISNPTKVDLPYAREAIASALGNLDALLYEPSPFGPMPAREAIAAYYARRGILVSPEDILVVATTSEAYTFLFRLLANPGDGVAVPRPSYPLFNFLAELSDVQLEPYHLRYGKREGWRLDASSLEEAIDDSTRALITVSPNNPTGSALTAEEKQALADHAAAHELAIISDEVFLDYLDDPTHAARATAIGTRSALTFALSGLSKVAGLPQLKVSWIVLSGPTHLKEEARGRLEIIADTFLSVSTPAVRALPEILTHAETFQAALRARIRENRQTLSELTAGTPISPRRTDGGWYAMVDLPEERDDEAWALEFLSSAHLLVHPGYLFDVEEPSAAVLSTIVQPNVFREGVRRLVEAVARRGSVP